MKHQPIQPPAFDLDAHITASAVDLHIQSAVDLACTMPKGRQAIGEALCAALESVGGGAPRYDAFGDMREDARWWADMATPMELETYTAAALRRITRTTFADGARKRLFWAMWGTMTEKDRAAFLGRVQKEEAPP